MAKVRIKAWHTHMWPAIHRLNCLYHVYPAKANDVWRANVRQLSRRMGIFTGRKIVAVAMDESTHTIDTVRHEFRDDQQQIEFIATRNDPDLREAATLEILLETVESHDGAEASFYGHTKGNSTKDNAFGAELWRNAMYHHLLDHVHVCRDLLMRHPCVGTHKMVYPTRSRVLREPYPTRLKHGSWLYAGTFFWFRHDAIFGADWRNIPCDRYGAEAWLSGIVSHQEAATVFQPWPATEYPTPSPYDPRIYRWPRRDE